MEINFNYSFKIVLDHINSNLEGTSRQGLCVMLMDYMQIYGEDAILDMHGFIHHSANLCDPPMSNKYIMGEIVHDLHGRKDEFMVPRTEGYKKHLDQNPNYYSKAV